MSKLQRQMQTPFVHSENRFHEAPKATYERQKRNIAVPPAGAFLVLVAVLMAILTSTSISKAESGHSMPKLAIKGFYVGMGPFEAVQALTNLNMPSQYLLYTNGTRIVKANGVKIVFDDSEKAYDFCFEPSIVSSMFNVADLTSADFAKSLESAYGLSEMKIIDFLPFGTFWVSYDFVRGVKILVGPQKRLNITAIPTAQQLRFDGANIGIDALKIKGFYIGMTEDEAVQAIRNCGLTPRRTGDIGKHYLISDGVEISFKDEHVSRITISYKTLDKLFNTASVDFETFVQLFVEHYKVPFGPRSHNGLEYWYTYRNDKAGYLFVIATYGIYDKKIQVEKITSDSQRKFN